MAGPILSVIALLLFMARSASPRRFLHVWLPFAMEAPTPVSGADPCRDHGQRGRVPPLIRMGPLYVLAPTIMTVVAIIGGVTALFAAVVALTQFDIKRILAYSTISQLGLHGSGLRSSAHMAPQSFTSSPMAP